MRGGGRSEGGGGWGGGVDGGEGRSRKTAPHAQPGVRLCGWADNASAPPPHTHTDPTHPRRPADTRCWSRPPAAARSRPPPPGRGARACMTPGGCTRALRPAPPTAASALRGGVVGCGREVVWWACLPKERGRHGGREGGREGGRSESAGCRRRPRAQRTRPQPPPHTHMHATPSSPPRRTPPLTPHRRARHALPNVRAQPASSEGSD